MIDEQLDAEFETLLRATLEQMIPKAHAATQLAFERESASNLEGRTWMPHLAPVVTIAGRRERRRDRGRMAAAFAVAAAVVVLLVAVTQRPSTPNPTSESPAGAEAPTWYPLIRPFLPDRFDQIALTNLTAANVSFMAWNIDTGQNLHISIATDPGGLEVLNGPTTTTDASGNWYESTSGVTLQSIDGRVVTVSCGVVISDDGGNPGSISQIGSERDYCGPEFGDGGVDATSRRVLVATLAAEFPLDAVGATAGAPVAPSIAMSTIHDFIPSDKIAETYGGSSVYVVNLANPGTSPTSTEISVIGGVQPPHPAGLNPTFTPTTPTDPRNPMMIFDDVAYGWMVNAEGTGIHIATTDLSDDNLAELGGMLQHLAGMGRTNTVHPSDLTTTTLSATTTTTIVTDDTTGMPPAYADVIAMLPDNHWIGLLVPSGFSGSLSAYDAAGRNFGFSYIESIDDYGMPEPNSLPVIPLDGVVGYPQPGGGIFVTTDEGDGAIVDCIAVDDVFFEDTTSPPVPTTTPTPTTQCLTMAGTRTVTTEELVHVAAALMPLLREGTDGPLGTLIHFRPVSVDLEAANSRFREALGLPSPSLSISAGLITPMILDEPTIFRGPDGSTVLSMVTVDGVLFQTHLDNTVPSEKATAAMRLMSDLVELGGPTAMTSLPPA